MTDPLTTPPLSEASDVSNKLRWGVLLVAMLLPSLGAYLYFDLLKGTTVANLLYLTTKIFTIVLPIVWSVWVLKTGLPFRRRPHTHHLRSIPAGLVLGAAIVGFAFLLLQSPLGPMIRAAGPQIKDHLSGTWWLEYYLAFAIGISIIHSFIEEFFWRFFVYGQLCVVLSRRSALLLGGIAFSLHHVVVLLQFFPPALALPFSACVGIGGIFWSLLMDRQHSLAGAWASHMVVDFGMLGIGYGIIFP